MIIEVKGKIKEIVFDGDRALAFLIEDAPYKELLCTIHKGRNSSLENLIEPNKDYKFKGELKAYRHIGRNGKRYITNKFYIDQIID